VINRVLTGDTPTGPLHLGHWVGSLKNRLVLQQSYDCYFLIANIHAFTTKCYTPLDIRANVLAILADYLAVGLDPEKCTIFLQSDIPAIAELTIFLSMELNFSRLTRNPTLKTEIRDKNLGNNYPLGFLLYPLGQAADILCFRPTVIPVGEDQLPHLEMAKELAIKFNHKYGQKIYLPEGEALFPLFTPLLSDTKRLIGLGPPNAEGKLLKMSKSLNNAIYLHDNADLIRSKIMHMYTDPLRIKASDKGNIDQNPLWIFHKVFNPDTKWVEQASFDYANGAIGDVICKKRLVDVVVDLLAPIAKKRLDYTKNPDYLISILRKGQIKANMIANQTLMYIKEALAQHF
jgi:tryptophanyl-tRNA synthetase